MSCPNGFGLDRIYFTRILKASDSKARYAISPEQMYFLVKSVEDQDFAILDSHTTRILQKLLYVGPLRFQLMIINNKAESTTVSSINKITQKRHVKVSVNVYRTRNLSTDVDQILSREHIFLQHPDVIDAGVKYVNPQYFYQPGELKNLDHNVGLGDQSPTSMQSISFEVNNILESLDEVEEDPYIPQHDQLLTPLLE